MSDIINQQANQSKRYYWLKLQDNFFECAIRSWAKYKQYKNESVSQQQVELTLKQLHDPQK